MTKTTGILVFLILLVHPLPGHADYIKGLAAYQRGEYAAAYQELRPAAERGDADAQLFLGMMYVKGQHVAEDWGKALFWTQRAAQQGQADAQFLLGSMYRDGGAGVPRDFVLAYTWYNLASAGGNASAAELRDQLQQQMSADQIAQAQHLATEFRPRKELGIASTGSGFFINTTGHLVTNLHVIDGCSSVQVVLPSGRKGVRVVAASEENDLAVLQVQDGPVPGVAVFRTHTGETLGEDVMVAGYPLRGLLAEDLNIATGTVSALAGLGNDRRLLQMTAPVQSGNSGGPLLDETGQVIGVVASKLNALKVAEQTGDIPQNVNFAVKAALVRSLLDVHGIEYRTGQAGARAQSRADLARQARTFTFPVECWQ